MSHPAPGRPVVAGVDGSEGSRRAARAAAEEAHLRNTSLHLLMALPWRSLGVVTSPAAAADLSVALVRDAEDVLQELAADVGAGLGEDRVTWEVAERAAVDALRDASGRAQLLVLGCRGVGGVAGLVVGSTATAVVAAAGCPVLVLSDDTSVTVRGRRSVVVGVEGRPGDDEVLGTAFDEAASRGTDLVAVHAWQDARLEAGYQVISPLVDWDGVRADEERVLAEALAGWRDKHPDVVVREVVLRDRTARGLLAAALTAELLVIGHRRRGRLSALGSTTHGVLHRAPCPLVVVPLGAATGA
ncbi:universal stress protein [Modestobacter sp. SSW1-42]|uniref:universal stress protein n=1 Tax=Modestobacter sp. SSW1-42 TaxID=596372 RepID=UPI003986B86C